MSSRRVYIHAHSLRQVCMSDRAAGEEIIAAMIGVGVKKRLYNRLVQDGQMLLGLDSQSLSPVQSSISRLDGANLTQALSRVHYRPAENGKTKGKTAPRPVFQHCEEIVASCLDDNYYTFATDRDAADRMYADCVPIKDLRRMQSECPQDPRVVDLTMIRGNRLMLVNPCQISAPKGAYVGQRLTNDDLMNVARAAQSQALAQTEAFLRSLDRALFPENYLTLIVDNLLESIPDSARPFWGAPA